MNKYAQESQAAQAQRHKDAKRAFKERSCKEKKRYASREDALVNHQKVYQCSFCRGFHCSSILNTIQALTRRKYRPNGERK